MALITGGGRGLGRAFAQALAAAGATIAVVARSADQLADTVESIKAGGGSALALPADITNRLTVKQMAALAEQQLGLVDVLINAAGITTPLGPAWEVSRTSGGSVSRAMCAGHSCVSEPSSPAWWPGAAGASSM